MPQYETTIEQEIRDQGADHILGLGRGALNVERLSEELEGSVDEQDSVQATFGFIRELDEAGSNGYELVDALTADRPSAAQILEGLKSCSVRGTVNM